MEHKTGGIIWRFRLLGLIAVAAFCSCSEVTGPDLDTVGRVGFWDGEGGCWSIATSEEIFHPTHLPDEFRVDGLRVRFTAERKKNLVSFCPGEVIELIEISAIEGD